MAFTNAYTLKVPEAVYMVGMVKGVCNERTST